jgi:monoamine oxidase
MQSSLPSDQTDVLIIGAGFSGLAAAHRLRAAGKSVRILEARDRVGGRVKAGMIAGTAIDLGGMWVGTGQARLMALVKRQQCKTYPTWLEGRCVIEMLGRTTRCPREDFSPALPLFAKLDYALLEGRLKRMIESIPLANPAQAAKACEWDAMSLGEWIRRNVRTKGLALTLTLITRSIFCAEPDDLSFLHFLFYLKSGGGLDSLISAEPHGAQYLMVEGGLHSVAAAMAAELGPSVVCNSAVLRVEQGDDHITLRTEHVSYVAKHLIVALAPTLAGSLAFSPPLPHAKDALHQRMPMGSVIKCWIAYATPFWRAQGLNAFISSDQSGFSSCFDVSPPSGPGLIAGFFDASEASIWSARTSYERKQEVLSLLTRALGSEAQSPIDYVEKDWTTDPWSRGCYAAYAPPGVLTRFGAALRAPIGRIHWAGTETATEGNGYVEGALQAGERAADEIIGFG